MCWVWGSDGNSDEVGEGASGEDSAFKDRVRRDISR